MSTAAAERRIVFLGPPGAGKGTQALLVCRDLSIPHISTGEILRAAVKDGSELGLKVKAVIDSGELVPDALMIEIIRDRLNAADCDAGFLFDGFPRTVEQARALNVLLTELSKGLTHIIELQVPEDILTSRLKKRGAIDGRVDDSDEVVARRLKVYWEQTAPVSRYYAESATIVSIDGLGSVEEVHARVMNAIKIV